VWAVSTTLSTIGRSFFCLIVLNKFSGSKDSVPGLILFSNDGLQIHFLIRQNFGKLVITCKNNRDHQVPYPYLHPYDFVTRQFVTLIVPYMVRRIFEPLPTGH